MNKPYYLSVGIDVGADFSFMSIVDPQERILLKQFKIINTPNLFFRPGATWCSQFLLFHSIFT